jgi:hydroxypyruvate isomerase
MSRMHFSTSISLMFREHPVEERFEAAKQAGFEGVEIQFLAEGNPGHMAGAAQAAGIEVVLINVGMGDYLVGGPGFSGVPGREAAFLEELDKALEAARLMRARFVHLGPSRIPEGVAREACLETYRANLDAALALHAERGSQATLLIEPMNRIEAPTALINDIDDGAALLRDGYAGRIGLQFDIYHVAMNGHDVLGRYRAYDDLVCHVQFSDIPGRQEPGAGTLDFPALFSGLQQAGYEGWFGAEYMPRRPTIDTLAWFERYRTSA